MIPPHGRRRRAAVRRLLLDNGTLTALIVLVIAMSALSGDFLTTDNLLNVGVQAAVTAVLAFGVTFVIVAAGIDLSVGSVAALSATVLAWSATQHGVRVVLAVVLAVATGIAAGLVNGFLIAYGKLPPFIATLAMLSVARGLSLVISEGSPIAFPDSVSHLGDTLGGWLPAPVLVMIVMGLLAAFVLGPTYIGRSMCAIGGNEEAARLSGLRVKKQKLAIYALSGVFAAVAGVVLAARLSSAQPQAADGYELDAIAAVVIGGASLAGGTGKASGTLIGALILAVLRNGLNLLSVSAFWQQVVIGVVIALAVLLDTVRRKAGATPVTAGFGSGGGKGRQAATYGLAAVVTVAIVGATSLLHGGGSSTANPRIGLALSTLNNPFFVQIQAGAKAEAKKLGVDLTVTDAQNDASQQANQLQNFTSSGLDSIIVNPVDSDAAGNSVKAADKAKIPVIAVDRGVNKASVDALPRLRQRGGGRAGREDGRREAGRHRQDRDPPGPGRHVGGPGAGGGLRQGAEGLPGHPGGRPAAGRLRPHQGTRRDAEPAPGPPGRAGRHRRQRRDGARRDQGARREGRHVGPGRRVRRNSGRAESR